MKPIIPTLEKDPFFAKEVKKLKADGYKALLFYSENYGLDGDEFGFNSWVVKQTAVPLNTPQTRLAQCLFIAYLNQKTR